MGPPIRIIDLELSNPPDPLVGLSGYAGLCVLARWHGQPIGTVMLPGPGNCVSGRALVGAVLAQHGWSVILELLRGRLAVGPLKHEGLLVEELLATSPPVFNGPQPLVTVAVCTRDRPDDVGLCLDGLAELSYPNLDLLVVDNAPKDDRTKTMVRECYPSVRYVLEPRPGLDWARNRAIIEARGEIIAFTDDDVVVDPEWVSALVCVFTEDPQVMAVTGLVVPYELETEAQISFEMYGGFGRGFARKWYHSGCGMGKSYNLGAGIFGTGANMAYRCELFAKIGGFDPALDVGTATQGGGDLEFFFRLLQEGHVLVYEPSAVVHHRHRRDYAQLRSQVFHNGTGLYAYFVRSALAYPSQGLAFLRFGLWWLWRGHIRRLLGTFLHPPQFPRALILAEIWGSLLAPLRYAMAQGSAARIARTFGRQVAAIDAASEPRLDRPAWASAVRTVELSQPLRPLRDVQDYERVRLFVSLAGRLLGSLEVPNFGRPVSATRLRQAIVDGLSLRLLEPEGDRDEEAVYHETLAALVDHYLPEEDKAIAPPPDLSVSVVVATLDRPAHLRACLGYLVNQQSARDIEIVVVDNNPASGLTPAVVAEFPGTVLVDEPRRGLAYARNAGFRASTGDIVITTDDDVVMPATWLERMLAPFAHSGVMAVTGNTLPIELETAAQEFFEEYGGLGRGFRRLEANGDWFMSHRRRAVPTWELGATANAAFRASAFSNPSIGLMDEALGPGMPSGVGEDTYLFYRILKAGYTIVYEPAAYVWHKHRREMRELRKQLYDYSKGHVAYHLTTLLRDRDLRALFQLMYWLPKWHARRIRDRLRGRSTYPLSLISIEILGNLVGPLALTRSRRRVKREGRSGVYIPAAQRPGHAEDGLSKVSLDYADPAVATGATSSQEFAKRI